jgi:hypothetical protein
MKRLDAAIIALGLLFAAIGLWVAETAEGRFITLMATLAAVLAGLDLNHTITRAPRLVVSYRNPRAGGRPVVWRDPAPGSPPQLQVWVENRGSGPARAVEVEFDKLNVDCFGEGGMPFAVNPPRYMGGERVLGPHQQWMMAGLHSINTEWSAGTGRWRARADGMEEQTGEVKITLLDEPPP